MKSGNDSTFCINVQHMYEEYQLLHLHNSFLTELLIRSRWTEYNGAALHPKMHVIFAIVVATWCNAAHYSY